MMQRRTISLQRWIVTLSLVSVSAGMGCGGDLSSGQTDDQSAALSAIDPNLNPDFDLRAVGMDDRSPYANVYGTAGGTRVPVGSTDIYAYVFVTDAGIFAVTSHFGVDSGDQTDANDNSYHVHKATLNAQNCVTSLVDHGLPSLHNHIVSVPNTGASKLNQALTAKLSPTANGVCVTQVWDHIP